MAHQIDKKLTCFCPARDRLLSLSDTLKVIGISRSSAYRLLTQGLMPKPIKIGSLNFFSELELQAWIAQKLEARGETSGHE